MGITLAMLAAAVFTLGSARAEDKVELKPLNVGATLYFGQLFNIDSNHQDAGSFSPTVTLPYTSLWMIQRAAVGDRLKFNLGVAGSFFYPFPETITQGYFSYRTGGVAIAEANGSYIFGDLEKPWLEISVGQQGYKYNPYARNFGEYMFRSEAYPTSVRTGDWGPIDNAGAGIWGVAFKGRFLGGMVSNDLLVTLANERLPLHDVSITDIVSLNLGKVFQIGAGVSLSRLIQIDKEKSAPQIDATGWFTWTAEDAARLRKYVDAKAAENPAFVGADTTLWYSKFKRNVVVNGQGAFELDTALEVGKTYWADSKRPLVQLVSKGDLSDPVTTANPVQVTSKEYIDTKAITAMGRFSFDPKPLFGIENALGPMDLVLYGEAAVLGFENYPIFYKKISERMPIMLGFNLPTFRLLDYLTFEMEIMKNPHLNSSFRESYYRRPEPKGLFGDTPVIPDIADEVEDGAPNQYKVNWTEDDFKWSVTALKSFGVWNVAGQFGNDHFRPLRGNFTPSYTEAMTASDSWYYMIRLLVNL